jgi:hypothetical protein
VTTPVWQAGTIYAPGALVQPASAIAPVPNPVENGDFEAGVADWTLAAGFSIGEFGNGTHFDGTWSLQWDLTGNGRAINDLQAPVTAGQSITASCQVQQGASSSGQAGARAEISWYDASDDLISISSGNLVNSTSSQNWKPSTVTAVAPAGAAYARFTVYAFRTSGGDELWVDACTWNALITELPDGLVFRAVQATAGYSGSNEPVWPVVVGNTVVDNEVTWEAVIASRVVWEAAPILVSGQYEPDFPVVPDGTVLDGTIIWKAMNFRITDPKCPQTPIVQIAASKVFAADGDIIPFCATVNCLDWSTPQDAGFIPFGLQTFGSNDVAAMGLYRGNLIAFNLEGYQMWQVDEDPANMAFLDASPVGCTYNDSVMPVSNDLVFLTAQGIRNIGIAGASTNLQAGFFGKQIDPLVLAAIRAGVVPKALFYPGAGQYWLFFGAEAFVLTMNGGPKDMSWSRYEFPEEITDWTLLGDDLYLRAGDLVWRVSDEALLDDVHDEPTGVVCTGEYWYSDTGCEIHQPPPAFNELTGVYTFNAAQLLDDNKIHYDFTDAPDLPNPVPFLWSVEVEPDPGDTLYFWYAIDDPLGDGTRTALVGASGTINVPVDPTEISTFAWGITTTASGNVLTIDSGEVTVTCATVEEGTDFEGYIAWPYLDFGRLGVEKSLESFDVVATGEFTVAFGYNQANFSLATTAYALSGDTLPGTPIPMPISGPSFQMRLTFAANQQWEWMAAALHLSDNPGLT